MISKKTLLATAVLFSLNACPVHAALMGYTVNGDNLVYDTNNYINITWTQDGNLLGSNPNWVSGIQTLNYTTPDGHIVNSSSNDFIAGGAMTWWGAKAFIYYLNLINYGGSSYWTMPSYGANPDQLAELNAIKLNGAFIHGISYGYWSNTETNLSDAWAINTNTGVQSHEYKSSPLYVWSITSGQIIKPLPEPPILWLTIAGFGLFSFLRPPLSKRGKPGSRRSPDAGP